VLIVTAHGAEHDLEIAFAAGATDYLSKPIRPIELVARLRSALRLKEEFDRRQRREQELLEVTRQLREANEALRFLSDHDELTRVANRRTFNTLLGQEWKRAAREVAPLSLILIDIDHFKNYNDHFGHQQGDVCLRQVAWSLSQTVRRATDLVARY